ncbi:hypothetical protein ES705_21311 [subsurface metagenome]
MGSHSKSAVAVAAHAALDTGVHGVGASTVCSEIEAAALITIHAELPNAHHTPTKLGILAFVDLKNSNDPQKTTSDTGVVKLKEIQVTSSCKGSIRIKFDLKCGSNTRRANAAVYRNGAQIGSTQTTQEATYSIHSEDFDIDWVAGDLIQIYGWGTYSDSTTYVQNFQFFYAGWVSTINQDP